MLSTSADAKQIHCNMQVDTGGENMFPNGLAWDDFCPEILGMIT